MKIYKTRLFLLSSALCMGLFQACTDADNPIDQVFDGTVRGAVLRTIAVVSNELPIGQSTAGFAVDLELQDAENGDLVETVNVYVRFTDNTIADGGTDFSKPEIAAGTIPRADFTTGPRGLPQTSYSIGLETMQSLLGIAGDQVDGGDVFRIRFELVLTDGRTYSLENNTATLTGTFFSSPFVYNATVVCPPAPPTPGDWIFDMVDAYGDSWNGASLTVTLDGVEIPFLVDATEATASVETLTVPPGAQVISIKFNSGSFDGEVGFTVTSASGNVVTSKVPYGAETPVGVELINYCIQNY